ncbi:MAG: GatB/YqeY domain-containing protein [Flavobacteriales bacterium]
MSLKDQISNDIRLAMLAKEKEKLEALRAIKAALMLEETKEGAGGNISEDVELKTLQKLYKQRVESATIYRQQNRIDLAEVEEVQAEIIKAYLPAQMSEDEVRKAIQELIASAGATGPADMGKVVGAAVKTLGGKAEGKLISELVKQELGKL